MRTTKYKIKLSANTEEKCNTETRWLKKYKEDMFYRQIKLLMVNTHIVLILIVNKQRNKVVKININQIQNFKKP
jgi:hypothetical protein